MGCGNGAEHPNCGAGSLTVCDLCRLYIEEGEHKEVLMKAVKYTLENLDRMHGFGRDVIREKLEEAVRSVEGGEG